MVQMAGTAGTIFPGTIVPIRLETAEFLQLIFTDGFRLGVSAWFNDCILLGREGWWAVAVREIRCVNPACATLNRVPRYSLSHIPECGKCHTKLPEADAVRLLRKFDLIPRPFWVAIPVAGLITWSIVTQSVSISTQLGEVKTADPQLPRSQSVNAAKPITCEATEPLTIHGIYRVYDTYTQPRLTQWTINAGVGANYFVKLVDAGTRIPRVSYFVYGGSNLTTDVPLGSYVIKHASGETWCGERELFGVGSTALRKGRRIAIFDDNHTYMLFLTPTPHGNFPTDSISRNEF